MSDAIYLEPTMLENLSQFLDQDKLFHLLERYLHDGREMIQQLEIALQDGNTKEARRMVHSLKSTSANIGATPLAELSKALEALACDSDLQAIDSRMDELHTCFAKTAEQINQLDIVQARKAG